MKSMTQRSMLSGPHLDCFPDSTGRVGAVELVDRNNAGGRSDVDLGQPLAADHVDADEDQTASFQLRTERGADFLLGSGQLGLRRLAANSEIGPDLALARDAVDRPRHLAVDQ